MKKDLKIDWDKVSQEAAEEQAIAKQKEVKAEENNYVEGSNISTEITTNKKEKSATKTKYEKHKLRPINFISWIFIFISNIFASCVGCYISYKSINILTATKGVSGLFGAKATAYSIGLLPFLGILIDILLIGLFLLIIAVAILLIVFTIRNLINVGKLNYAKDEDYTKNLLIVKTVKRLFVCGVLTICIYLYFLLFPNYSALFKYGALISAIIMICCAILLIIDLIIAKKRFIKNNPKEIYYPILEEKKRILRLNRRGKKLLKDGTERRKDLY